VLQDINFTVQPGEAVGIIGMNGAGKSTLLKMITGTTQPTTGSVHMTGRVAALLELGHGLSPRLHGPSKRLHGRSVAGLQRGRHQPASCPRLRPLPKLATTSTSLCASTAAACKCAWPSVWPPPIRPDMLIVDEALSVGDAYFQHKSFDRIREFRKSGTTLLLVSHDKGSIQSICDRAILLNAGRVAMEGEPEAVMDYYNAMLADRENQNVKQLTLADGKIQTISGTGEVIIDKVELLNEILIPVEVINIGDMLNIRIRYTSQVDIPNLTVGFMIKDRLGQPVYGTNTYHLKHTIEFCSAHQSSQCIFTFPANIGIGSYSIAVALHSGETHIIKNYEWRDLAVVFNVVNLDKSFSVGACWLPVKVY
jgi:lipopolysaccharide transport system ATP-binding protein